MSDWKNGTKGEKYQKIEERYKLRHIFSLSQQPALRDQGGVCLYV